MVKVAIRRSGIGIAVIVLLVGITGFLLSQLYGQPKTSAITASNVAPPSSSSARGLNVFKGTITNAKLEPQSLEGTTSSDKGCYNVGGGLVECSSDIITGAGTINFQYRHNMNEQPCLDMVGHEKVIVNVLDSDGNAEVIRTQELSGMGGHHG